jgi:NAD(P)-dependent dehydrogenase (short-subunit alcohol dehydrogenase family)
MLHSEDMVTALTVGASQGLGLATAENHLERGWLVIAPERTPGAFHKTPSHLPNRPEIDTIDAPHETRLA